MLTGKRAFHGDSAADTMSAILREDPPDLSVTNQNISPGLERIVRHCLEKSPEQRFHSAHDLAFDLGALSGTSSQTLQARPRPAPASPARRARRPRRARGRRGGVFRPAGRAWRGGCAGNRRRGVSPPHQPARRRDLAGALARRPDARLRAPLGNKLDIWVQRAGGRNPIDLTPDCDQDSYSPAFSPDGSLIAYGSQCGDGGLYVMGATGESARRLAPVGSSPAWSPDGREIFYATELMGGPYGRTGTSAIWAVEMSSGKTRKLSADFDAIQPAVSPHGLRVAYWGLPAGGSQRDIWTMPYKGLAAGEKAVPVTQDPAVDFNPVWGPDGRTLYFLSNRSGAMNLWRVPIDEATGRPLGPPEAEILPAREVGGLALSGDGRRAAYVVRENTYSIDRLVFDPASGKLTGPPEQIVGSSQEMADMGVSPDGSVLAFDSRGGSQDDLFLVDSNGRNLRQITDDAFKDRGPSFSPDGKRIAFHSDRNGRYQIWTIERDGSGLKPLSQETDLIIEAQWSPDGRAIATNSGLSSTLLWLDDAGNVAKTETIPVSTPDTFFLPLGWTSDGKVAGPVIRLPDQITRSMGVYSPGAGAAVRTVPSSEDLKGRIRRGAVLGARYLLYLERALHIIDLETGQHRVVLDRPTNGGFQSVGCARTGGTCYVVRTTDNADIWQMTLPEAAR